MVERKLLSVQKYENEHIYYLAKEGAEQIDGKSGKRINNVEHTLMRTEAWLYLKCPELWQIEQSINLDESGQNKIRPDAFYFKGKELYCVEIDLKQSMKRNREKMEKYAVLTNNYYIDEGVKPIIHFFTNVESRKKSLTELAEEYFVHIQVHIIHL